MNMRNLFPGYYQPTDQEFDKLWKECIFSFDTNVLLHIYRYSPKTRERLFDILKKLQERIWIPHQVGYEFHKNRETVISSQSSAYDKLVKILEDNLKIEKIGDLNKDIDNFVQNYRKHSTIEVNKISVDIKTKIKESLKLIIESVKDDVKDLKDNHPDLLQQDLYLEKMTTILDGRIGNPYPNLLDIYKLAEERFQYLIPPGYKDKDDKNKSVPDIYGDAILWLQLIDYAKSEKKPIIFVTDDDKEDWWVKSNRKTIRPRPELVQEMLTEAGVKFYMYSADRFLDYAQKFLELTEQPEVIEEAREIREQDKDYFSDAIEESDDFSTSGYRFNELEPAIAELRKISSTIIAAQTQTISELTENLKPITQIPKTNYPDLQIELRKICSDIVEALKPAYEITKMNLQPLDVITRSIAEISKINSPLTEKLNPITQIPRTNYLYLQIEAKNIGSDILESLKPAYEITKMNLPNLEISRGITDISKINSPLIEDLRSITQIPKTNLPFSELKNGINHNIHQFSRRSI